MSKIRARGDLWRFVFVDSLQGAEGSGAERSQHLKLKLCLVMFDRVLFRLLRNVLCLEFEIGV